MIVRGVNTFVIKWRLPLLVLLLLACGGRICATEKQQNSITALTKLTPDNWTKERLMTLFGKPTQETTEGRKMLWVYQVQEAKISIQWEKEEELARRINFESGLNHANRELDYSLPDKLKLGATPMSQAIKILGMPDDMSLKKSTQEMHYTYNDKVLRLFFRDRVLVDFTLY